MQPTTVILDSFQRADENPLSNGGTWTSSPLSTDSGGLQITLNAAGRTTAGGTAWSESYWNAQDFGPDVEVAARTIGGNNQSSFSLIARLTNPGASANCYYADFDINNNVATLYKYVSGISGSVGSVVFSTFNSADIIQLRCIGTSISLLRNDVVILNLVDSAVTGVGKVGCGINNATAAQLWNFAVGNVLPFHGILPALKGP